MAAPRFATGRDVDHELRFEMIVVMSRVHLLKLLGLQANATRVEIKARYHELARKFHPDVNGGDERSHARFRAIVASTEELLAGDPDAAPELARAAVVPRVETESPVTMDRDSATPKRRPGSDHELVRRRAELRARLDQCTRTERRLQAEVEDGDAKAVAARNRGNESMARHFDRRVDADRSQLYALLGKTSEIERELRVLEAAPGVTGDDNKTTSMTSASESDRVERVSEEVERVHDQERAALKRKYMHSDSRR